MTERIRKVVIYMLGNVGSPRHDATEGWLVHLWCFLLRESYLGTRMQLREPCVHAVTRDERSRRYPDEAPMYIRGRL